MPRSAQCLPISFDFRPKSPATGTIHPQHCNSTGRFPHSLEELSHQTASQRAKTSSRWKNPPDTSPSIVQKLPVTGRIIPPNCNSVGKIPHTLEEYGRKTATQREDSPTHWKNYPDKLHLIGQNPPVAGRIRTDSYPLIVLVLPANGEKWTVKRNRARIGRN